MDETISRGVVYGGRNHRSGSTVHADHRIVPPVTDRYNFIYLSMVLAGAGFLLPYNSLISAVDFYKTVFPGSSIIFDISLVYILTSLLAVLLNNILIDTFTLNSRIQFGYLVSIATLSVVLLLSLYYESVPRDCLYAVTLLGVAIISLGATVQQSSFYGYTSMLPHRYTQAVMTGESLAGVIASANRICTKLMVKGELGSTGLFFTLAIITLLLCLLLFPRVQRSAFVAFYISIATGGKEQKRQDCLNKERVDDEAYEKLIQTQVIVEGSENYQIPEFGSSCRHGDRIRYHVEDVLVSAEGGGRKIGGNIFKCFRGLNRGLALRIAVAKRIVPYMTGIMLTYAVTLSLFPGIESEIVSCSLGEWMPVVLIATFNLSDLVGKMLASVNHTWSRAELVLWPLSRILLLPLLVMCAAPKHKPVFPGELAPFLLTILLGLSNGLWGSLPMILAPAALPEHQREHTGNLMTISYSVGLTLGSLLSYWLDTFIGNSAPAPCPRVSVPYSPTFGLSWQNSSYMGFKI